MNYTDHEQRLLDQQSGAEMDRIAMRPKDVLTAEVARWAEEGRRRMWAEYDRAMADWPNVPEDEEPEEDDPEERAEHDRRIAARDMGEREP